MVFCVLAHSRSNSSRRTEEDEAQGAHKPLESSKVKWKPHSLLLLLLLLLLLPSFVRFFLLFKLMQITFAV